MKRSVRVPRQKTPIHRFAVIAGAGRQEAAEGCMQTALAALAAACSPVTRPKHFFEECLRNLADAYSAEFAFCGVFTDDTQTAIKTVAVVAGGRGSQNVTYDLAGTPCEDALRADNVFIERGVQELYPCDHLLAQMGVESYFGAPLVTAEGDVMGLIAVLGRKPMVRHSWTDSVIGLFANRIALELERQRIEQEIELSASVFENSHEGIMIFSADWQIRKVNRAFTKITGYEPEEVIGKHARIFACDRHDEAFYLELMRVAKREGRWEGDLWSLNKSGGLFGERRTITAVRDPATGRILHYVSIFTDISEEKFAEQRINRLAHYDQTTELPNRLFFSEKLSQTIAGARSTETCFALMILNLDKFKAINESYGHMTGDRLLKAVGDRLQTLPSDHYFAARLGGDEFAVICRVPQDPECAEQPLAIRARALLDLIGTPFMLDGEQTTISASMGIALYPRDGADSQAIIRSADFALAAAKANPHRRTEFYRAELCEQAERQVALTKLLRKAVSKNQFRAYYQSKHAVDDGRLTGYEALIRWQLDDGVLVSPVQFIPVAEETGLIVEIGQWMLGEVCRQIIEWRRLGYAFGRVSVNISGRQLTDPEFVTQVAEIIGRTGVDPSDLELEITESWLMVDPERSTEILQALRGMGFKLSIDDFGIAYSSMNYLKHFPVDIIKVDRSFVRDILTDRDSQAIVSAIIAMGHNLGREIIAEGVETMGQLDMLRSSGCDEAQGYLFSRPVPPEEVERARRMPLRHEAVAS